MLHPLVAAVACARVCRIGDSESNQLDSSISHRSDMMRSRSQRRTRTNADDDGDVRIARSAAASSDPTTPMSATTPSVSSDADHAAAESTSTNASPPLESGACRGSQRRPASVASFVAAPPSLRLHGAANHTSLAEHRYQLHSSESFNDGGNGASASPLASPPASVRPSRSALHRSTEVYGFVLWISTFVLAMLYLAWALLPDATLHALGVSYYPSRWWALALPAWSTVALVSVPPVYLAWNMFNTLPLDHLNTISDGWTHKQQQQLKRQEVRRKQSARGDGAMDQSAAAEVSDRYSIPDCVDIPLERINQLLYRSTTEGDAVNVR